MDWMKDMMQHFWEIVVTILTAILSLIMVKYKKKIDKQDVIEMSLQQHSICLQVLEERIRHLVSDIEDIKDDLKQILYKL